MRRPLSALAAGLLLVLSAPAASAAGVDPSLNRPETWAVPGQTTCAKTDLPDGVRSVTLPADGSTYALVVLKAGRVSETVSVPVAGVAYSPSNGKDVSHVIVCTVLGDPGGEVLS
ncbi:MAG TPA: hypothetical protein PKB06_02840 [Actinotalea sp.]|nr:hypothetical protein [Actinotalea sp.]